MIQLGQVNLLFDKLYSTNLPIIKRKTDQTYRLLFLLPSISLLPISISLSIIGRCAVWV